MTNLFSIIIVVATYFWMIYFLSNVNSFWDVFRGKEVQVRTDNVAPLAPFLDTIPEATNKDIIDINGRSEPGVKVLLFIDGTQTQDTIADADGNFSFFSIPVGLFPVQIYATAEDESANQSSKSTVYSISKDTEEPEIEIITPKPDEVFKSTGHSYQVTGKTEAGATVLINDLLAVINPEGDFSASLRLEEGTNEIRIKATDKAGNETETSVYMKFEKIN